MKNLQSLLNRIEVQVQLDLEAEQRKRGLLDLLAAAVRTGKPSEIQQATESLKEEIDGGRTRATKRTALLEACAEHFGVPASCITLASIAERAGAGGERLVSLRSELRDAAAGVARMHRGLSAAIRCQRRVIGDALAILLADENGNPMNEQGMLVDAEV